jgi:hypothetical protein
MCPPPVIGCLKCSWCCSRSRRSATQARSGRRPGLVECAMQPPGDSGASPPTDAPARRSFPADLCRPSSGPCRRGLRPALVIGRGRLRRGGKWFSMHGRQVMGTASQRLKSSPRGPLAGLSELASMPTSRVSSPAESRAGRRSSTCVRPTPTNGPRGSTRGPRRCTSDERDVWNERSARTNPGGGGPRSSPAAWVACFAPPWTADHRKCARRQQLVLA